MFENARYFLTDSFVPRLFVLGYIGFEPYNICLPACL